MSESRPHVTIIGAGVAGMSAAFRLLEAGCPVTVIEKTERSRLGGQFGTVPDGARRHEHAFHIFADWNQNFFALCKDIGLRRPSDPWPGEVAFVARPAFLTLTPLDDPHAPGPKGRTATDFRRLEYLGAQKYFWKNANAGVAHWSDMMLYEYSILDLLSDDSLDNETSKEFLNRVSVNGFMRSKHYASDVSALLHQELLLKVFAVPSYRTSARSYQTYLCHSAAFPPGRPIGPGPTDLSPSFWSMNGNVHERFWRPFMRKVEETARIKNVKFRIRFSEEVTGLTLGAVSAGKGITHIHLGGGAEPVDGAVLLAVPPAGLIKILKNSPQLAGAVPELKDVGYLEAVPVPALNLYFNKRIDLPPEHITLFDKPADFYNPDNSVARKNGIASQYGLSLVDHSRLWLDLEKEDKTVLSVLAADATVLMEEPDHVIEESIIRTLRRYIRFDEDHDIAHRHLQSHRDEPLFVNTEGSWDYRPEARLDEKKPQPDGSRTHRPFRRPHAKVSNLFLAGDYCRSEVDIVSVEAAIVTGLSAANLICPATRPPIGSPTFKDTAREPVRQAKALMKSWIDLAIQRSKREFLDQRAAALQKARVKSP